MRTTLPIVTALVLTTLALFVASCPQSGGEAPPATTVAGGATTASNAVAPDGSAGGQGLFAGQDFQFTTMDGQMHKLSEFAGKPVVLNYFGMG